jgi:hypothetical protein
MVYIISKTLTKLLVYSVYHQNKLVNIHPKCWHRNKQEDTGGFPS